MILKSYPQTHLKTDHIWKISRKADRLIHWLIIASLFNSVHVKLRLPNCVIRGTLVRTLRWRSILPSSKWTCEVNGPFQIHYISKYDFFKCLRLPAPAARLTSPILPPAPAKVSQTGQHSPAGVVTLWQSGSSTEHWTSSQSATPFWQAQTRQGSGLQISSCWCVSPSTVQPSPVFASVTEAGHRGGGALPWQRDQDFYLLSWLRWWQSSIYGPLKRKQPHACFQLLNPQCFFNGHIHPPPQKKRKKKKKEEKVKIKSSCSLKPSLCGGLFQEKPQKKITGCDCSPLTTERNHTHSAPHYKQHNQNLPGPDWPEPD